MNVLVDKIQPIHKRSLANLAIVSLYIVVFYAAVLMLFYLPSPVKEYPSLRHRLGTILSHSSEITPQSEPHTYCYYPSHATSQGGEYLLKRVKSYQECTNTWFGVAEFYEGKWVSEREKLWWSQDHNQGDDLASSD